MRKLFSFAFLALLVVAIAGCGRQPTDLTYTTKSSQARDYYLQGLEKSDNFFFAEARALFAKAVEADPDFAMAYFQWAQVSTNNEDFLSRLNQAVALSDKIPEAERLVITSGKYFNDNEIKKAGDYLIRAVKIYPQGKRLAFILGNFYYGQQNFTEAEKEYRRTIAIDPNFAPPYNILAYLMTNLNRYDEAIELLKKYAAIRPGDPNPHDSMGEIYLYQADYENSIKEYNNSLSLDSTFVISLAGLGHNHVFRGDFASGRALYEQIKARAASTADTNTSMFWAATSYCHEGNYGMAVKLLNEQLEFDRARNNIYMEATIYGQIGEIYRETGEFPKALEAVAIERQLAANPQITASAREAYLLDAILTEGICYAKMGKLDSANVKLFEFRAITGKSSNQNAIGNMNLLDGIISLYDKEYDKAIDLFGKTNVNDPIAKYYKALTYEMAGSKQEAAEAFNSLAKFNRNSLSYGLVRPRSVRPI